MTSSPRVGYVIILHSVIRLPLKVMNPGPAKATVLPIDTSFSFRVNDDLFERENGFLGQPTTGLSASPLISSRNIHAPVKDSTSNSRPNEARKLLWHVLSQLMSRRKPESVVDAFISTCGQTERSFGTLSLTFKEAVKGMKPELKSERTIGQEDDSDDIQHDKFSTDDTINLVIQLNNVLATSIAQGWHIFDERFVTHLQFLVNVQMRPPGPLCGIAQTVMVLKFAPVSDFLEVADVPGRCRQVGDALRCRNSYRSASAFLVLLLLKIAVIACLYLDRHGLLMLSRS